MKNKAVVSAALLAVAIVVLGFTLKAGIDNFTNRDRVVTVRGLCEKEVNAMACCDQGSRQRPSDNLRQNRAL